VKAATQRKVHVIDDDDAVRDSMRALLESLGIAVCDYPSARDFLDRLGTNPKGCVLLDLHMPGMTGLELLDLLRGRGYKLPVIVISGRSDPLLKERVLRAGALSLLDKPVDEPVLMSELDRAFAFCANER
jgi:FixJ family two-component response regulator